jgi:hypothetical protein
MGGVCLCVGGGGVPCVAIHHSFTVFLFALEAFIVAMANLYALAGAGQLWIKISG